MEQDWYYYTSTGARKGPIQKSELLKVFKKGNFSADTPVWATGMSEWVPFRELFAEHVPPPPPESVRAKLAPRVAERKAEQVPASVDGLAEEGDAEDVAQSSYSVAAVDDRDFSGSGFIWFLFSTRGRIRRAAFWSYHFNMAILGFFIIFGVYNWALGNYEFEQHGDLLMRSATFVASMVFLLVSIYPNYCVNIKRLHDIGLSGWIAAFPPAFLIVGLIFYPFLLLFFVSGVGIFIMCGFMKGVGGSNKYGAEPAD